MSNFNLGHPKYFIQIFIVAIISLAAAHAGAQAAPDNPGVEIASSADFSSETVQNEVARMAKNLGLDPAWAQSIVSMAQHRPQIRKLVLPPPKGSAKNWQAYRSRFIDNTRISAGLRYWRENRALLERAQEKFGVPAQIIVGIIGVETIYGKNTGNVRTLDALATLGFDFPNEHPRAAERQAYFRNELGQFLLLAKTNGFDPLSVRGSYAGALGWPQFMPGSWNKFAVDFDGDGKIDLFNSQADIIGSVANYFKMYGWQTGMPTHYPVRFDSNTLNLPELMAPDILPSFSPERFNQLGAILPPAGSEHNGKLALIELQNGANSPSYVAGTENFYVITRYNWSSYYAMSVIDLGQEIAQRMGL